MAEHDTAHTRGEMDIAEQVATYEAFNVMTKWGSLYIGALVLFLTVWFAVGAGFLTAFISAVVLIGLGTMLLRDKPAAAEAH